jgi:predicted TIM-barrel fold metal-dependent hydrolase
MGEVMDSAAIILAVPAALWALAWWDVQRRKQATADELEGLKSDLGRFRTDFLSACRTQEESHSRLAQTHGDAIANLAKVTGAIERDHKELSAIVSNNRPKLSKFQRGG